MNYYVLIIDSGVEAETLGPYGTSQARDRAARQIAQSGDFDCDYDSIFRLDVERDAVRAASFHDTELYEDEKTVAE